MNYSMVLNSQIWANFPLFLYLCKVVLVDCRGYVQSFEPPSLLGYKNIYLVPASKASYKV
jgi:hypothetical protein